MSFTVRIYGYRGIYQLHVDNPQQAASDSIYALYQPYEWATSVVASGTAASTTAQVGPSGTDSARMIRIEVPDGSTIRYEINPPNRTTVASAISPSLSGINNAMWGAGWTISVIDATGL